MRPASPESRIITCSSALTARIRELEPTGIGAPHILLAALQRVIEPQLESGEKVPVMIEGHGRRSRFSEDIGSTVGWFTTLYPILLPSGGTPAERAAMIRDHIDSIGADADTYLRLAIDPEYPEIDPDRRPDITFNYLGYQSDPSSTDSDSRSDAYFSYTDLNAVAGTDPLSRVEINALIERGELRIIITTGRHVRPGSTIALTDGLVAAIEEVVSSIEHRFRPSTQSLNRAGHAGRS